MADAMRVVLGAAMAVGVAFGVGAASNVLYQGTWSASSFHGTFVQWGGTASVSTIRHAFGQAFHYDRITIHEGEFRSGQIDFSWLNGYPYFTQNGGLHINSNGIVLASSMQRYVNRGSSYSMNGGMLSSPHFVLAGGSYSQSGGTNVVEGFGVGAGGRASVGGGTLNAARVGVAGILTFSYPPGYTLVVGASYEQNGGTTIAGEFGIGGGGSAHVEDGVLSASNLTVSGAAAYHIPGAPLGTRYAYASFEQSGGRVVVQRQLTVGTEYSCQGGSIEASTILLGGRMAISSPEIVNQHRFMLAGGKLEAHASCRLGRLELRTNGISPTVSQLIFNDAELVQFRNSRNANRWSPRAYLVVKNWRGSTNGGGANQFRVGANGAGLSPKQLNRIVFENPADLPPGAYSARMLATGEVVPNEPIGIALGRAAEGIVLAWRAPYYLETTTDLASRQWTAVTQASPLEIGFSEPQRYFRLRRH